MKYPAAVATLVLVLFIALAETPSILSGEAEKWYVYEYSEYYFWKSGEEITSNYSITVTFKVVQVNETAYRIELLGCEGDELHCEMAKKNHEVYIKHRGGVDTVFVIPYGEDKVYRHLFTRHYIFPSTLWTSIEVLEDAVKSFQILSNLLKTELSCKRYRQCIRECSNRSEWEEQVKCFHRCMMGYQGEIPVRALYYTLTIALDAPRSPTMFGPIPECVLYIYCGLGIVEGIVKFEKVEARKLSSAYVYEVIYAYTAKNVQGVVISDQSGRVKTVFSVSGWLLEGMVEHSGWRVRTQ